MTSNPPRILLLDHNVKRARATARVLRTVSSVVEINVDVGAAPDLVVVAGDDADALARALQSCSRDRVVVTLAETERKQLTQLFDDDVEHVVADTDRFADDLLVTAQKIVRADIFGIQKYFPWGAQRVSYRLRSATQRDELMSFARGFGEQLGVQSRRLELLTSVADELATNAIYNAPTDALGARPYACLDRTENVELSVDVELVLAGDGRRIGISMADPFGSLGRTQVLRFLSKGFRGGEDQIDDKRGGAGLGFYQMYESVSHLVVNVEPGVQTEVIGLISIEGRYKDFVAQPKSMNVFVRPGGSAT